MVPKKYKIHRIQAREIISSAARPTIETTVTLGDRRSASVSVPFGASTGKREATTLLDRDKKRYLGTGMLKAMHHVNEILSAELKGMDVRKQQEIDQHMLRLDRTPNKRRLGGNTILSGSLATARAAALALDIPLYKYLRTTYNVRDKHYKLPKPLMVMIEGGEHADNSTDIQEYLIAPMHHTSVHESVRICLEVYAHLKTILQKHKLSTNVGNEGAYAPAGITSNTKPFELIIEAIRKAGYKFNKDMRIGIDSASSQWYNAKKYYLKREKKYFTSQKLIERYQTWVERYKLFYIEDGLAETDWNYWTLLNMRLGNKTMIVGDDLTVTNLELLRYAIDVNAINAVIIKPNQIGTLTQTMEAIQYAHEHRIETIVSHRGGGETNDTFIVDLACAVNAAFLKVGPSRGERVEKYNRLLAIEQEIRR